MTERDKTQQPAGGKADATQRSSDAPSAAKGRGGRRREGAAADRQGAAAAETEKKKIKKPTKKPAVTSTKQKEKKLQREEKDRPAAAAAENPEKKTDEKAPQGGRASLPSFGFAQDVLGAARPTSPAPAKPAAAAGTQRIYDFADTLEQAEEEAPQAPQRLETWITFRLAGETFGLPVEPVREVMRVTSITRVPHAPQPIRGVTNLRGRVIPVIDLRQRIDLPPTEIDRTSRILVVSSRRRVLGLLVDSVQQVLHIDLNRVQPPPEDVMTAQSDYVSGVYHLESELLLLLDVDRAMVVREAGGF